MAGFSPVGSLPVASVPAGSGVLTELFPGTGVVQFYSVTLTIEWANLKIQVYDFQAEVLADNDPKLRLYDFQAEAVVENNPYVRVADFQAEAVVENDPFIRVYDFQIEVLRSIENARANRRRVLFMP